MRPAVKAPLRPFEYMAWAQSVPMSARYDLTGSGVADVVLSESDVESWLGELRMDEQCRRDLREGIIDEYIDSVATRYGVDASNVTPTLGASLAITHVLMALVRAGDHVVVERPTYEALHRVPEIFGASVSRLERKYDESWAIVPDRLAKLLTPRTRAVVLTNLHNPSGVAIDADTLHAVAELTERVGAVVLVDEVYLDFCWDLSGPIRPACLVAPNAVSWSSGTKCFGFSALRSGWIVTCDPEIARALRATADYLHVYVPMATAKVGARVVERSSDLTARARAIAREGRGIVERWLQSEKRVAWIPPADGLSGCVRLPELLQDTAFCEHLRSRYETQVVPGSMFEAPGFVRLSFGLDAQKLEQGLANFSAALDDLVG
jgi:aspartate/methionine/tyrosine aminotransferase